MDITKEARLAKNNIESYQAGKVIIDSISYDLPLLISNTKIMKIKHFSEIESATTILEELDFKPDIILFGTGENFSMIPDKLSASLYSNNIGFEVMNTSSACRTYSLLASDLRPVAVLLY